VRSSASFFNPQYPLFSLRSIRNYLRLLPPLPFPSIFPSIMCFRRQFLCTIHRIQLAKQYYFSKNRQTYASNFSNHILATHTSLHFTVNILYCIIHHTLIPGTTLNPPRNDVCSTTLHSAVLHICIHTISYYETKCRAKQKTTTAHKHQTSSSNYTERKRRLIS
jgi:hypothetical protein